MPSIDIVRQTDISRTPRVMQVEGMFDVAPTQRTGERWSVDLTLPEQWNIGVIVGPSGCGKTTIANELFGQHVITSWSWPHDKSVLDGFPSDMSIKDITALLSSVGFSSPPAWLRPFHVLSNGEQFRVSMARTLAEASTIAVVDEFTSVVDRTVAQIGSAAIAKTVRHRNQQFIAVTCHYDILEWLEPDWIYEPATNTLTVGRRLQRPTIRLEITRVHTSAWELFRRYHYLDHALHKAAACFIARWNDAPVAFIAILPFPHATRKNTRREHRVVCLPDYQGVGIGNKLSEYAGALCKGLGWSYIGSTSHPGVIAYRYRSPNWRVMRDPSFSLVGRKTGVIGSSAQKNQSRPWTGVASRLTASFEYVGAALSSDEARRVWS